MAKIEYLCKHLYKSISSPFVINMDKTPLLVGIIGQKGSGKSLTSSYIKAKYPKITSYSLSVPIKKIGEIFGFPMQFLYGTQEDKAKIYEPLGISAREFLQKFGTEIGREMLSKLFHMKWNNIWIQLLDNKICLDMQSMCPSDMPNMILIDDIRFKDEAEYIKSKNGILIKLIRTPNSPINNTIDMHRSEQESNIISPHYILTNDGSIDDLYQKIDKFICSLP
jgi:hypothetical protein